MDEAEVAVGGKRARHVLDPFSVDKSTLECPVCLDIFRGEIFQCNEGHTVCALCWSKMRQPRKCHTCRAGIPSAIRNRGLEEVASRVPHKCQYEGCEHRATHTEVEAHEKMCRKKPYMCPVVDCKWEGGKTVDDLMEHMKQPTSEGGHASRILNIPSGSDMVGEDTFAYDARLTLDRGFDICVMGIGWKETDKANYVVRTLVAGERCLESSWNRVEFSQETGFQYMIDSGRCFSMTTRKLRYLTNMGATFDPLKLKIQVDIKISKQRWDPRV